MKNSLLSGVPLLMFLPILLFALPNKLEGEALHGIKRVLFLGDSITYSGQYVEYIELIFRTKFPKRKIEFLNVGLPSETCCGLSEPNHAGGAFPRPNVQDRIVRALELTKPDLVVACYGMNDGIYYPFSEERFEKFKQGVRLIKSRVEKAHAELLLMTPPVFDPVPIASSVYPIGKEAYGSDHPFDNYDDALAKYSKWLMSQKRSGWNVIDIHTPMKNYLNAERARNPEFKFANDGVHINDEGHWMIAERILATWKFPAPTQTFRELRNRAKQEPEIAKLIEVVHHRQTLLKDAWLTEIGHKRPGMTRGLPIAEALLEAEELDRSLETRSLDR